MGSFQPSLSVSLKALVVAVFWLPDFAAARVNVATEAHEPKVSFVRLPKKHAWERMIILVRQLV